MGGSGAFCLQWKIAFLRTSQVAGIQFRWPLVYFGIIFSVHFFIDVLEFKSEHFFTILDTSFQLMQLSTIWRKDEHHIQLGV